jgi:hypothetical protein
MTERSEVDVTGCARRGAASRSLVPPMTVIARTFTYDSSVHR